MQIQLNGQLYQVRGDATLAELLEQLDIPAQQVAVEVNLELIPRAQHAARRLAEADQVEVVRLVGGG